MANMTVDQKKWRAEEDAYTLTRAAEIEADIGRRNAAKKEAKNILKRKEEEIKGVRKVAGVVKLVKKKPVVKKRVVKKKITKK